MSKLMSDLGENYEYMRIIVENKIELKKLEVIEDASKVAAYGAMTLILSLFTIITICSISIVIVLLLFSLLNSYILSLLSFVGIILLISAVLIIFRKQLIINPTINIFYTMIKHKI